VYLFRADVMRGIVFCINVGNCRATPRLVRCNFRNLGVLGDLSPVLQDQAMKGAEGQRHVDAAVEISVEAFVVRWEVLVV
jgi:hypothetical protein